MPSKKLFNYKSMMRCNMYIMLIVWNNDAVHPKLIKLSSETNYVLLSSQMQ